MKVVFQPNKWLHYLTTALLFSSQRTFKLDSIVFLSLIIKDKAWYVELNGTTRLKKWYQTMITFFFSNSSNLCTRVRRAWWILWFQDHIIASTSNHSITLSNFIPIFNIKKLVAKDPIIPETSSSQDIKADTPQCCGIKQSSFLRRLSIK